MPYPKKLLNDYETVALDLHPHWWFLSTPVFALVGSIVLGIVVRVGTDGDTRSALSWIALVLIVVTALWLVVRYLRWATTNFVITSDRLIFRQGVLAKSGIEIPLERVNNVNFTQSIFERLLGAGDLLIESGGEDGQSRFRDIRKPERVQNIIHAQMEANDQRSRSYGLGDTHVPRGLDVASQLEKLEGMVQRGTLTAEEFAEQKRRLLGA